MREYKTVKDLNGVEVKASDIHLNHLFIEAYYEKGTFGTLRNEDFTFWADVETISKKGDVYRFRSTTYGHIFEVNFKANTVKCNG